MTAKGEEPGQRADQTLGDIVRDADEYYNYLTKKHATETRLDVAVVSLVVWFASFAVLGFGVITQIKGAAVYDYLAGAFLFAVVFGVSAGVATYLARRKRGFKFAELGAQLKKMKEGGASSEDGLRLMDVMQQAALVMKKREIDSAFKYGVIAFAVVAVVGRDAAIGALSGIIVYLYFRFEALREYERGERGYEDSKRELLQSL
ncbi:MAG TPA: hypothetical protein VGS04_03025 [Nitrososphaerales archaeon]|nr:hypothetical protein [Nitrososphaerales archaeon]